MRTSPYERVELYIDGNNFFTLLRDNYRYVHVDYAKLAHELIGGRYLVRSYFYTSRLDREVDTVRYDDQARFLHRLEELEYFQLELGTLALHGNSYTQKGIDVALAIHMLEGAYLDRYDTAILVSGDADFCPAVHAVKARGKHVEVACFEQGLAEDLRAEADRVVVMDWSMLLRVQLEE